MNTNLARKLRNNVGEPERAMWRLLHSFRQQGFHFRRQVEIGSYFADFAEHGSMVVIEVDGDSHAQSADYDEVRNRYMTGRDYKVLRFSNRDVMGNPEGVYERIAAVLRGIVPTPRLRPVDPTGERRERRPRAITETRKNT
jgi:very-short-patch-repair endonuclease